MAVHHVKEVRRLLESVDFGALWNGFHQVPFAIYDDQHVFLSEDLGSALEVEEVGPGIYRGEADERFAGNTVTMIGGRVLAIWDASTIDEFSSEQFTAYMVHEMFHAHQYGYGEKRFPNELLGAAYPLTVENMHLRYLEREFLLRTCTAETEAERREALAAFFAVRREREQLIGEFLGYEKAIESVEGTAVYIEYKTYMQLSRMPVPVAEYLAGYRSTGKEQLKIRAGTYPQGVLLSLAADEFLGEWKEDFTAGESFLSDFLEEKLHLPEPELDLAALQEEFSAERDGFRTSISEWERERDETFADFERNKGESRIEGGVKVKGIDPMNMLKRGDEVIHRNFLRIDRGNGDELLAGPLKTKIGDSLFDVLWIEW